MHNVLLLIKNYFLIFIGNLSSRKNTKKYISGGLICLLVGAILIATFCSTSIMTTKQFLELSKVLPGAEQMAMYSNIVMGLLIMGLFTVMRSIYPTKNTDFEMLSSLPLTKLQIITSKIIYNYLFDVISFLSIILPSFIVYFVLVPNTSIMVVVWGIVFVMLGAIISNAISYIISLFFLRLSSKFKNFGMIQSLLTLLLLVGFMVIQYSIPGYLNDFTGSPSEYLNSSLVMKILINWILNNNLLYFGVICLIAFSIYAISLCLRVYYYGKGFKTYQTKEKNLVYEQNSILKSLYLKETKHYFHSPMYFINTIIGCFFVVGISVAYRIIGKEQVLIFLQALPEAMRIDENILIVIISSLLLSTTVTTCVSLSLEGKNIWFLKAHPIKIKDVFLSKILLNVTLCVVAAFFSALLFTDFTNPLTFIPYFIIPALNSIVISILGLIVNLYFPKLNWTSEEEVVKRGMSVLIGMACSFLVSLVLPILYFSIGKNTWDLGTFSIVGIILNVVLIGILSLILKVIGPKKFINL